MVIFPRGANGFVILLDFWMALFLGRQSDLRFFEDGPECTSVERAKLLCSSKSDSSFGHFSLRNLRALKIFKPSVAQAWERLRKIAWERFVRFLSILGAFGDRSRAISRLCQRAFRSWEIFEFTPNIGGHSVLSFHPSPHAGHSHLIFLNRYFHRLKKKHPSSQNAMATEWGLALFWRKSYKSNQKRN